MNLIHWYFLYSMLNNDRPRAATSPSPLAVSASPVAQQFQFPYAPPQGEEWSDSGQAGRGKPVKKDTNPYGPWEYPLLALIVIGTVGILCWIFRSDYGEDCWRGSVLLAGIDEQAVTHEVKCLYVLIQGAWDRRDMADLATMTTEEVLEVMRAQAKEDPRPSKTDLIQVKAHVQDVEEDGSEVCVSVLFDVLMRETPQSSPEQVREVWYFLRDRERLTVPKWRLARIEQP